MWYYYITPTVNRIKPIPERFVTKPQLESCVGFRSVYAYDANTVDKICYARNFRQLQNIKVFSDELLVDFDTKPLQAFSFVQSLRRSGVRFSVYGSGNRSIHVHVSTVPYEHSSLPRSQRRYIEQHATGADSTIYTPVALYRLPNTWHEKNPGHRKTLREHHDGQPLELKPQSSSTYERTISHGFSTSVLGSRTHILRMARQDIVSEGGRRVHAWRIAALAYDTGHSYADALQLVLEWNDKYTLPPLDYETVEKKVYEAYQQRTLSPAGF